MEKHFKQLIIARRDLNIFLLLIQGTLTCTYDWERFSFSPFSFDGQNVLDGEWFGEKYIRHCNLKIVIRKRKWFSRF